MDGQMRKKAKEQENRSIGERDKDQETSLKSGEPIVAESFRRFSGSGSTACDILALQRTVGNQAVQRLLAERGALGETQPTISRQESAPDPDSNHNHPEYLTVDQSVDIHSSMHENIAKSIEDHAIFNDRQNDAVKQRVANLEAKNEQ